MDKIVVGKATLSQFFSKMKLKLQKYDRFKIRSGRSVVEGMAQHHLTSTFVRFDGAKRFCRSYVTSLVCAEKAETIVEKNL